MSSASDFLSLLEPAFDFAVGLLSFKIFGVPLFSILLSLLILSIFAGFITTVRAGMFGGISTIASKFDSGRSTESEMRTASDTYVLNKKTGELELRSQTFTNSRRS